MNAPPFLLEKVLRATVGVHSHIPPTHVSTAIGLGTDRRGTGTVVSPDGLILTVHYLLLGAKNVIVTMPGGDQLEAKIVGKDYSTGIGLLQDRSRSSSPASKSCRRKNASSARKRSPSRARRREAMRRLRHHHLPRPLRRGLGIRARQMRLRHRLVAEHRDERRADLQSPGAGRRHLVPELRRFEPRDSRHPGRKLPQPSATSWSSTAVAPPPRRAHGSACSRTHCASTS